jgi:hypothetical protein
LQTTAREGAIIDIEVGCALGKFPLTRIAYNPHRKSTGSMDDFLRDVGTKPAKHQLPAALVLQDFLGLGKCSVDLSKAVKHREFAVLSSVSVCCHSLETLCRPPAVGSGCPGNTSILKGLPAL